MRKICFLLFIIVYKTSFAQDYRLKNRVLIPDSIVHKFIEIYEFPFGADPIEFQTPYFSFIEKTEKGYQLWNMDYNSMQLYCYDLVNQKITIYGNGKGKGPGELLYPPSIPKITKDYVYLLDRNQFKVVRYNRSNPIRFKEFQIKYPALNLYIYDSIYVFRNEMFLDKGVYIEMDSLFNEKRMYGSELFKKYDTIKLDGEFDPYIQKRLFLNHYPIYIDMKSNDNYTLTSYENFDFSIPVEDLKYDNNRIGDSFVDSYEQSYLLINADNKYFGIQASYISNGAFYYDLYTRNNKYINSILLNKSFIRFVNKILRIDKNIPKFMTAEGINEYMYVFSQDYKKIAILDMFECAKYYQAHYQNSK